MRRSRPVGAAGFVAASLFVSACSVGGQAVSASAVAVSLVPSAPATTTTSSAAAPTTTPPAPVATTTTTTATAKPAPPPFSMGNPNGHVPVPAAGQPVDTSRPTRVVGNGTPASCTSQAVVGAVAAGGVITFACGPAPVTITMTATAKVRNASQDVVLDGGGLVTLSGGGAHRILYEDTCDAAQGTTSSHCDNQATPRLTLQNLTLADGNATGQPTEDGGGGGAVFDRGGQLTVVNARFVRNRCDPTGPDLGGAAIRALSQYQNRPVYIVGSTFGGAAGQGGVCANGGALSSIGVSWVVLNSVLSHNSAIGHGANPPSAGTPGGGSGGAIYTDGNTYTVRIAGTVIEDNEADEGGGAVFFVSNDKTGSMSIEASTLRHNPSDSFETPGFPGIFFLGARPPAVTGSTLTK